MSIRYTSGNLSNLKNMNAVQVAQEYEKDIASRAVEWAAKRGQTGIEFKVTVVGDVDREFGIGKLLTEKGHIQRLVEAAIYEQVAELLDAKRDTFIPAMEKAIERRVESILKTTTNALESEIVHTVRSRLKDTVASTIDKTPMNISISFGGATIDLYNVDNVPGEKQ